MIKNNIQYKIEKPYAQINPDNINFGNNAVKQPKVNIDGAKLQQLDKDAFDYSIDDGKISPKDKLKNFAKGLITPITAMFSSPKNFLIGASIMAAAGALTIATGGAIAPLFVALGVTGGAIQIGTGIYKANKATTDDEAKSAWQGMGSGTSAVGMSVIGSKSALKGAGVKTEGMGFLRATVECFKQVPSSVSKSIGAFTSGKALANLHLKPKKTQTKQSEAPEQKIVNKPKTEEAAQVQETKPSSKIEDKTVENFDDLSEVVTEKQTQPKSETVNDNVQPEVEPSQAQTQEVKSTAIQQGEPVNAKSQTIVKSDGTKIALTYDENGQIAKSIVTKPDETIIVKVYQNGKCTGSHSRKKVNSIDYKELKYADNGKIASIQSRNSKKMFNYNQDGEFVGYFELDYPNNTIKAYDAKGKLTNAKSDFSADIESAINKLNGKQNFDKNMLIKGKNVVRKTTVVDKQTGSTVDAYITEASRGEGSGKQFNIYVENSGEYKSIGLVTVDPNECGDGYIIKNLYGSQSQKVDRYKGAGTELLKQCSIDSFNCGEKGIFGLVSGNYESDAFYRHIGLHGLAGHFELAECGVSDFLLR